MKGFRRRLQIRFRVWTDWWRRPMKAASLLFSAIFWKGLKRSQEKMSLYFGKAAVFRKACITVYDLMNTLGFSASAEG